MSILSRDWQYQSILLFYYWYFFFLLARHSGRAHSLVGIYQQRARVRVLSILNNEYNTECGTSTLESSRVGGGEGREGVDSVFPVSGKLIRAATMWRSACE